VGAWRPESWLNGDMYVRGWTDDACPWGREPDRVGEGKASWARDERHERVEDAGVKSEVIAWLPRTEDGVVSWVRVRGRSVNGEFGGPGWEFEKGHRHRICSAHVTPCFASEKKGLVWRQVDQRGDTRVFEQEMGGCMRDLTLQSRNSGVHVQHTSCRF